ncbi:hypothetical protein ccbrp13_05840 [Ktedonobacteria bacterium brp13]|nr:hypothetical protein ccbrp13_05840 [Ktedonobacteria bacterium brp13]
MLAHAGFRISSNECATQRKLKGTYTFLVEPDGAWSIAVYDNFTGLPKHLAGGHIHALQGKIKLAAVVAGSHITVYVNGQKPGSMKDKTYNSGTVGIALDQGAIITVDSFSLYNPA